MSQVGLLTYKTLQLDDLLENAMSAELAGKCEWGEGGGVLYLHQGPLSVVFYRVTEHVL